MTIHSFPPRSQGIGSTTTSQIYFIIGAALVVLFIGLRIFTLRRHNQALSDFFRFNGPSAYRPNAPNDTSYGSSYRPRNVVQLAPIPAAHHRDRGVRAVDTDEHGRRLGLAGEDLDGKDVLPPYNNLDRPPMYVEAWPQPLPHPAMEQPAGASAAEQRGGINPHGNAADHEDQAHENVDVPARLPPVHHDPSTS